VAQVAKLPFIDSFDHYNSEGLKWSSAGVGSGIDLSGTASRTGIGCCLLGGVDGPSVILPNVTRLIVGTAFFPDGPAGDPKSQMLIFTEVTTNSVQLLVGVLPTNAIALYTNSINKLLGQSAAGVISPKAYNYVEVDSEFSSDASIVVRVNGTQVLRLDHVNNIEPHSLPVCNAFQLKGYGVVTVSRHDDVYVLPDPGLSVPVGSGFLGPIRIYAQVPFANGAPVDWVPLRNQNWQEVGVIPPDGAVDNVTSSTVGAVDQYQYDPIGVPIGSQVKLVQHSLDLDLDDGSRTVASDVGGVVAPADTLFLAPTIFTTPYLTNPLTGVPWELADFPAAFGPKIVS
jgi:hypothetical protein